MFGNKKAKKIDNLVTGLIIGTAVASIFGLSKTKKGKEITKNISKKSNGIIGITYQKFCTIMDKIVGRKK